VKCHGDGAFVVAEEHCQESLSKAEVTKECLDPEPCSAGWYWKNCSLAGNSMCTACPDLRLTKSEYAQYEAYVDAAGQKNASDVEVDPEQPRDSAAVARLGGTAFCRSRCVQNAFRHEDGRCKPCRSRELVLKEAAEETANAALFFAVLPCAADKNTVASPCEERTGTRIASHDPAETGECPRACLPGFKLESTFRDGEHEYNRTCAPCEPTTVMDAQGGALSELSMSQAHPALVVAAYTCALECQWPYVLLRERLEQAGLWDEDGFRNGSLVLDATRLWSPRFSEHARHAEVPLDANRTCVRCSENGVCSDGSYPTGPLCQCADCVMPDLPDAVGGA
jgi:hypothetical protein